MFKLLQNYWRAIIIIIVPATTPLCTLISQMNKKKVILRRVFPLTIFTKELHPSYTFGMILNRLLHSMWWWLETATRGIPWKRCLPDSLFFNKVAGLMPTTLLKKILWHRCFPVNFTTFLGTPFLQNTSGRLLLYVGGSK